MFHDGGFELHSPSALIDLKAGRATGDERVEGHGPSGAIDADGFRVLDGGARILFGGHARLTLRPDAPR